MDLWITNSDGKSYPVAAIESAHSVIFWDGENKQLVGAYLGGSEWTLSDTDPEAKPEEPVESQPEAPPQEKTEGEE